MPRHTLNPRHLSKYMWGIWQEGALTNQLPPFFVNPFRIVTDPEWVNKLRKKGRIDSDVELDESGITPSQVISFEYHLQAPNIIYSLLYRDSVGQFQLATWNFLWAESKAKTFKKAFLNWMSTTAVAASAASAAEAWSVTQ